MRFFQVMLFGLLAFAFAGCGPSASAPQFLGTWQGTMQVSPAAIEKLPAENVEQLKNMRMEMTIRQDGTMKLAGETAGKPYSAENRWELISSSPEKITIKSIDPEGQVKPIDLVFDNADSFHMPLQTEVADLGAMKFNRVR